MLCYIFYFLREFSLLLNPCLTSYRYSGKRCWRLGYRPRTHPVSCQRKGLRSFLYRGFCLYYHSVNLKHLRAFRGSVLTIMKSICTLLHRKKKLRKVSFNRLGDTWASNLTILVLICFNKSREIERKKKILKRMSSKNITCFTKDKYLG